MGWCAVSRAQIFGVIGSDGGVGGGRRAEQSRRRVVVCRE